MTNKINYKQFPNKEEFEKLYDTMSQEELAKHYSCNKLRIRKWLDHFGLARRNQGGGNNRKYNLDENTLREYVNQGYSNEDIVKILGLKGKSSLNLWLKKYNIKRVKRTTEYQIYARKVRYLTEIEYSKYISELNPENKPRTLCGVLGGYQLDHIKSVSDCFRLGISMEDCASKTNLQMLPWKENLNKREFHKNKDNK